MEPKQPTPRRSPEYSAPSSSLEQWNDTTGMEYAPENSQERERNHGGIDAAGNDGVVMPAMPAPVPVQADNSASTPTAVSNANPLTAGDDDLMEKEWVDRAKKIITNTKGDPYRREYEVGQLQADYIEKRYGKKLGEAA